MDALRMQREAESLARNTHGLLRVLPHAKHDLIKFSPARYFSEKFREEWATIETEESVLFLWVHDEYLNRELGEILTHGMYEYVSNNAELLKLLDELEDAGIFLCFSEDEVRYAVMG